MNLALIKKYLQGQNIILFDVGAKGGITDLIKLAPVTTVYAFEPNPEEHKKLLTLKHPYHACNFYNLALGEKTGVTNFRIANKPSYSSVLEFDQAQFKQHLALMPLYDQWTKDFTTHKAFPVSIDTIDHFCIANNISEINFLKLDTQGSELQILRSSNSILQHVHVIKCEVTFTPVYKEQAFFSEIDIFLKQHEFEFVDCRFYPEVVNPPKSLQKKNRIYDKPRFATGGDAIYMKNPSRIDSSAQYKMAIALASMGYLSEAYVLFQKLSIPQGEIESIITFLQREGFIQKLKDAARNWLPPKIFQFLKSLS
jgi:FkbM family methyltransferase